MWTIEPIWVLFGKRLYNRAIASGTNPKLIANWIMGDIAAYRNKNNLNISDIALTPANLAELVTLIENNTISGKIAKEILPELLTDGSSPKELVEKKGLIAISDTGELEAIIDEVLAAHPKELEQYRGGKTKLKGFLQSLNEAITTGKQAGLAIIKSEIPSMYNSLTLFDNAQVKKIPPQLNQVINTFKQSDKIYFDISEIETVTYFEEKHIDLIYLLQYISQKNNLAHNELNNLINFLKNFVITHYQSGGTLLNNYYIGDINLNNLTGLGLYFPDNLHEMHRYTYFDIYQNKNLINLYELFI